MNNQFTTENAALLLIDHQIGTMQLIKNIDIDHVRRATISLAKMAKILDLPVVLTSSQEAQIQGPLIPELRELLPDAFDKRVQRAGIVNAWSDPVFRSAVQATGRKNLIMAGVTTDVCLVFPAIDAVRAGFGVQAVMDASGSPFDFSETFAQRRMADAGVVITASNTLIAEMAQDWSTAHGQQLVQLLFDGLLPSIQPT